MLPSVYKREQAQCFTILEQVFKIRMNIVDQHDTQERGRNAQLFDHFGHGSGNGIFPDLLPETADPEDTDQLYSHLH